MPVHRLPSGSWQVSFKLLGFPRYRKTHPEARTRKQAETIESRLKQLAFEKKWSPVYGEELFETFCRETFLPMARIEKKSWRFDEIFVRQVTPYFKGLKLKDITPEHVRRFRDLRARDETRPGKLRSKGTVRREMAQLSRIFSYAVEIERLMVNPCSKVKTSGREEARTRTISRDEEERIISVLRQGAPHIIPVVIIAIQTGMRRGEILGLAPQMIDFEIKRDLRGNIRSYGEINLPASLCKSGKGRVVPLTKEAREILSGLVDEDRPLFRLRGYGKSYVSMLFKSACMRLGLEDVCFHTLRHTFGTRLAEAGVHQAVIKEILGHSSLQMTDRYVHPDQEMKHRAVQSLEQSAEVVKMVKSGQNS